MSIGAVAVAPSTPNIVWVGTGEANNRQSSSWGDGVYKSTDGGRSVDEHGPQGHALDRAHRHRSGQRRTSSTSRRQGISGARTPSAACSRPPTAARRWKKVLFVDDNTGATDLVIDPLNPQIALRRDVPAPAHGVGLQRRRPGQRHLQDHRRRRDLDEAHERPARGRQGPHRARSSRATPRGLRDRRGAAGHRRRLPHARRRRDAGRSCRRSTRGRSTSARSARPEGQRPRLHARLEPRLLLLGRRRQDVHGAVQQRARRGPRAVGRSRRPATT